jgi:hypothetical protein
MPVLEGKRMIMFIAPKKKKNIKARYRVHCITGT